MTPKQEKYLTEKYIRPMVKKMLKEQNSEVRIKDGYAERKGEVIHIHRRNVMGNDEHVTLTIPDLKEIFKLISPTKE